MSLEDHGKPGVARSLPRTLTLRRVDRSNELDSFIADLGSRLQRINGRISSSHWTIEGSAEGSGAGGEEPARYRVKIHLQVPGAQIHAASPPDGAGDADLYQVLRRAYADAKRQLQDLQYDRSRPAGI